MGDPRSQEPRAPQEQEPEIYVYTTKDRFLNFYDALDIQKVHVQLTSYDPQARTHKANTYYWLHIDEARLLSHLVAYRLFKRATGGRWERYGGSTRKDGGVVSRVFRLEWDEGEDGRFSRYPYRLTITNGPGKKMASGGITPAGEPTSKVEMRLPELDLIEIMLCMKDYILSHRINNHKTPTRQEGWEAPMREAYKPEPE